MRKQTSVSVRRACRLVGISRTVLGINPRRIGAMPRWGSVWSSWRASVGASAIAACTFCCGEKE